MPECIIALPSHISANNADDVEEALLAQRRINPDGPLTLDADKVVFISSAGLRVLVKLLRKEGALTVINASPDVYDIFDMTGLTQMMDVRRKMREVSVEGLRLIGAGAYGQVYRLDTERIIKVYDPVTNPPEKIAREKQVVREAFIRGIPSALSFDMVRVGDAYGIIYEMIDAMTLGEAIARQPRRLEEYAARMASLLRELHTTEFAPGTLPDAREGLHAWVDIAERSGYYQEGFLARVRELIDAIPARNTFIHGDFHPANIMVTDDDELMLIDLSDAAVGDPLIDLTGAYQIMQMVSQQPGAAERYTGMSKSLLDQTWDMFVRAYHQTSDQGFVAALEQKLKLYGLIRNLGGITFSSLVPDDQRKAAADRLSAIFLTSLAITAR